MWYAGYVIRVYTATDQDCARTVGIGNFDVMLSFLQVADGAEIFRRVGSQVQQQSSGIVAGMDTTSITGYQAELQRLAEDGFDNFEMNLRLLKAYEGDVDAVAEVLGEEFGGAAGPAESRWS